MKVACTLFGLAASAAALSTRNPEQAVLGDTSKQDRYLIETAPGNRRWIVEDEKWELRKVNHRVFRGKAQI